MGTTASPAFTGPARDATAFGGLVPSCASARSGETMVAVVGLEHYLDGAVAHIVVLTDAPGLIDVDIESDLTVRDDLRSSYRPTVLATTQGLGQVATTIWLSPAIAVDASRVDFEFARVMRVSPGRGDEPTVKRSLTGDPWRVSVDLAPERTVAEIPVPPERRQRMPDPGSVPARTLGAFRSIVPVGQAKHVDGVAVCVIAAECYSDRWVLTLSALGPTDGERPAPTIGRARISAWDDRGNRYRPTPVQGTARDEWSDVAMEMVPQLDPEAGVIAIRIEDIPCGAGAESALIGGPLLFGVRVAR